MITPDSHVKLVDLDVRPRRLRGPDLAFMLDLMVTIHSSAGVVTRPVHCNRIIGWAPCRQVLILRPRGEAQIYCLCTSIVLFYMKIAINQAWLILNINQ